MGDSNNTDINSGTQPAMPAEPCTAIVVGHTDPQNMGSLIVQLLRPVGNSLQPTETKTVRMMSPFFGATSPDYNSTDANSDDYNGTQKSYGMWMIPPDVGSLVVVIFLNGDPGKGYWIGCIPPDDTNFSTPGLAATTYTTSMVGDTVNFLNGSSVTLEKDAAGNSPRLPVAEYNKSIHETESDVNKIAKPVHPFAAVLGNQGLLLDDIRGITTSSSRREIPSAIFGISTPGPADKNVNANRGSTGTEGNKADNVPVSRLGGTTFIMDDGDDKYLRKTDASSGPPLYSQIEQGESDGNVNIPHNELVRIRTRTGHQILLHNSEDLIYIGNAKGTTWIELTSNGKIDIFAQDSISIHSANDLNLYADRDINMEAGRNVNVKAKGKHQFESGSDRTVIVGGNEAIQVKGTKDETVGDVTNLTVSGDYNVNVSSNALYTSGKNTDVNAGGNYTESADKINMNGPPASTASKATAPTALSTHKNLGGLTSIMQRIPAHEPWAGHENLDPTLFTPDKTDRDIMDDIAAPALFKTYTATTDTFSKQRKTEPTTTNTGNA
jgi:hypothetical protein